MIATVRYVSSCSYNSSLYWVTTCLILICFLVATAIDPGQWRVSVAMATEQLLVLYCFCKIQEKTISELPPFSRKEALRLVSILVLRDLPSKPPDPDQRLPRIIHRTGKQTEDKIPNSIRERHARTLKIIGEDFVQIYYTDTDALSLIRNSRLPEIVEETFHLLRGASRADLFRLCVLWVHGGIYLDLSYEILISRVIRIAENRRIGFAFDRPKYGKGLQFGFLSARPNDPILLRGIVEIVTSVLTPRPWHFRAVLDSTGPLSFHRAIEDAAPELLHDKFMIQTSANLISFDDGTPAISMYGRDHRKAVPISYGFLKNGLSLQLHIPGHDSPRVRYILGASEGSGTHPYGVAEIPPIASNYGIDVLKKYRIVGERGILAPINWYHRLWTTDNLPFSEKRDELVWRGSTTGNGQRLEFVKGLSKYHDVGFHKVSQNKKEGLFLKPSLTKNELFKFKYLLVLEGNDFSSFMGEALSSRCVIIMPKPKKEGWIMEGKLQPWVHYAPVEIPKDVEDVLGKLRTDQELAERIADNSSAYMLQFRGPADKMYRKAATIGAKKRR